MSEGTRRVGRPTVIALSVLLVSAILVALGIVVGADLRTHAPRPVASRPSAPLSIPDTVLVRDLRVGDCGLRPGDGSYVRSLTLVPCSQRHDFEVYAVFLLPAGPYPGLARVIHLAAAGCAARFAGYVGVPLSRSNLDYTYFYPIATSWSIDQFAHCLIITSASQRGTVRDQSA